MLTTFLALTAVHDLNIRELAVAWLVIDAFVNRISRIADPCDSGVLVLFQDWNAEVSPPGWSLADPLSATLSSAVFPAVVDSVGLDTAGC